MGLFGEKAIKSATAVSLNHKSGKCPAPVKRGGNACNKNLRHGQQTCGSIQCETWNMRGDLGI